MVDYYCPVCLKRYADSGTNWLMKHVKNNHPHFDWSKTKRVTRTEALAAASMVSNFESHLIRPFSRNNDPIHDDDHAGAIHDDDDTELRQRYPENDLKYEDAGVRVLYVPSKQEAIERDRIFVSESSTPFHPFTNEEDFNAAEMLTTGDFSVKSVNKILNRTGPSYGMKDSVKEALQSSNKLRELVSDMDDGLGWHSWKSFKLEASWTEDRPDRHVDFWGRNLYTCVKWLLRQPAYREKTVYAPERIYNITGDRIYSEINTADWWWEKQVRNLP